MFPLRKVVCGSLRVFLRRPLDLSQIRWTCTVLSSVVPNCFEQIWFLGHRFSSLPHLFTVNLSQSQFNPDSWLECGRLLILAIEAVRPKKDTHVHPIQQLF